MLISHQNSARTNIVRKYFADSIALESPPKYEGAAMSTENLGDKLFSTLQENTKLFESLNEELRFQTKTVLQSQLEKLDVVTREEFDATLTSLDRALQRIDQLEAQLKENT